MNNTLPLRTNPEQQRILKSQWQVLTRNFAVGDASSLVKVCEHSSPCEQFLSVM